MQGRPVTAYSVINPYQQFFGLDGLPLTGGKVYIGVANADPETNPIAVYSDQALSNPVTQPILTVGGYLAASGTPINGYVGSSPYSIRVRDKNDNLVFYAASVQTNSFGAISIDSVKVGAQGVMEPVFPNTESLSQASITSKTGNYALTLMSRTSDNTNAGSMSTTGLGSFVYNNNIVQISTAYCNYDEFRRVSGAGTTQGLEVQAVNFGSVGQYSPWGFDINQLTLPLFTSACRPDLAASGHNVTCAFGIHNNSGGGAPYFERGIVFAHDALEPSKNEAITMSQQHYVCWYNQRGWRNTIQGDGSDLRYESNTTSAAITHRFSRASSTGDACPTDCRLFELQGYSVNTGGAASTLRATITANLRGSVAAGHGSLELIQVNASGVQKGVSMGQIDQAFAPLSDNDINLGAVSLRWQNVYAGNGTIITSDATLKADLGPPSTPFLNAIRSVQVKHFQFLDMIAEKGADQARIHTGIIAQDLIAALEAEGLDWRRYGLIGEDSVEEEVEIIGEAEEPIIDIVQQPQLISEFSEDGTRMIQRKVVVDVPTPRKKLIPVEDEDGNPIMLPAIPERHMLNEQTGEIEIIPAVPERQYVHEVDVTHKVTKVVGRKLQPKLDDQGNPLTRYSVRYDQLAMAMIAALRTA